MNDLISILSEIRSQYNCFDPNEEPYYHALSEAIGLISAQPEQKNERIFIGYGTYKPDVLSEYLRLRNEKLPSVQPELIEKTASEIEKIKSESDDYLNELNSTGVIDWYTYNYAFDFYANLLMKAYEQGWKDCREALRKEIWEDGRNRLNQQTVAHGMCE